MHFTWQLTLSLTLCFVFYISFLLRELFDAVCWSWSGWCQRCNPATLFQCPRMSLSGLPTLPLPSCRVLSDGQLLWTQTTAPFVLPGLGMHSAIFSYVSASHSECQTCGPYFCASSSLSPSFLSLCLSEYMTPAGFKSLVKGPEKVLSTWLLYCISLSQNRKSRQMQIVDKL